MPREITAEAQAEVPEELTAPQLGIGRPRRKAKAPRQTVINLTSYPPSLNNLFINIPGRGRIRSPKYRAWATSAGWEIRAQMPGRFTGLVKVDISISRLCRSDLDNNMKALADLLVSLKIITDDSKKYVDSISLSWRSDPGVTITITSLDEAI